ncbi:MAG: YhdP family protein, partial [Burkholderiales bacterium]
HGRVRMRALPDGVELSGRGLALVMERGPEIPRTDFDIAWRPQAGGVLGASLLDLEAIGDLADSLPLPPQIAARLEEFAPRGRLTDSRLEWTGPFDAPTRYSARARFTGLALRPQGDVPGFSGISGSLEATQDKGRLHLASRKSAIVLPRVFPDPNLAFDSLAGDLEWQREGAQGFTVRVSSLSFANAHASGNLFGSYSWRGDGPGTIDLSAVANRADGRHAARYLPHPGMMGEVAHKFLSSAIVAGDAGDVRVRLRGDLQRFPFADPASGEFQLSMRIENGVLEYQPGWPRIRDISAELSIERDALQVIGRSGSILGAKVANVRVTIPRIYREAHVLVNGQAEGATTEFLKFLETSPLRDTAGSFTAGLKAAGNGRLRLKLDLPIAEMAKARVAGEYEFAANQVSVVPWLPPVEAAAGRLAFSESGFTLKDVRGRVLGGALAVSGGSQPRRGVEVVARGEASVEAAGALIDNPLRKYLSGGFSYVVNVREQNGAVRIGFESPLRGVESRLPAPLAKSAAEPLPLRVDVIPSARGERDRIAIALGGL